MATAPPPTTDDSASYAALRRTDVAALGFAMAANDSNLARRYVVARNAGLAFGGERDYYETLGYARTLTPQDHLARYLRDDISGTIVNAPAQTCWRGRPVVSDSERGLDDDPTTSFEKAVERLFDDYNLLHYLERWDTVMGLGEYGLLFLGVTENGDVVEESPGDSPGRETSDDYLGSYGGENTLAEPLEPDSLAPIAEDPAAEDDLAYLSVFSQASVDEIHTVTNPLDPRYGLPEFYTIQFDTEDSSRTLRVHHSRVIHAAEGLLENEYLGTPRLQRVWNRLDDLQKVVGGSAEMFWRGARRDLHLNYTGEGTPADADDLAEQADEYTHGLRNILRTTNVEAKDLGGQDVDPSGVVEQILKLISGGTHPRIPVRILVGSERGELASTQDRAEWLSRNDERREQFCEPMQFRAFVDRCVDLGLVPPPAENTYDVVWPDLFVLNELEQAEKRERNANALKRASPGGDPGQVASVAEIREQFLDLAPAFGTDTTLDPADVPELRERDDEARGDAVGPAPDDATAPDGPTSPEAIAEFADVFEDLPGSEALNRELATDGAGDCGCGCGGDCA